MTNLNNTEMNLTSKEIKLIALEANGVDTYAADMMKDFSKRAFNLIYKANMDCSYVVRRCCYLFNHKKIS